MTPAYWRRVPVSQVIMPFLRVCAARFAPVTKTICAAGKQRQHTSYYNPIIRKGPSTSAAGRAIAKSETQAEPEQLKVEGGSATPLQQCKSKALITPPSMHCPWPLAEALALEA